MGDQNAIAAIIKYPMKTTHLATSKGFICIKTQLIQQFFNSVRGCLPLPAIRPMESPGGLGAWRRYSPRALSNLGNSCSRPGGMVPALLSGLTLTERPSRSLFFCRIVDFLFFFLCRFFVLSFSLLMCCHCFTLVLYRVSLSSACEVVLKARAAKTG